MLQSPNSSFPHDEKMDVGVNGIRNTGDSSPAKFPAGLRVLAVDDDPICLKILEKMLRNCFYEVTTCDRAETALGFLRDNRNTYDVVISDVYMPDMDGFKLLEHIGLEMDLPVIMMSADDSKSVVMKGVTHGACDYLIKPIRMEALKNIWQHVVRRKKQEWKDKDLEQSPNSGDQRLPEDLDYSSPTSEGFQANSKKRKEDRDESDDRDESPASKKIRVVWTVELHQKFVAAVNQLGIDKAVPKKILELMNNDSLTRENVASHLQKYRMYLRKLSSESQHSFMGPPDFPFRPHNAAPYQLSLQAATLSNQRFLSGQQNNTDNQVGLLHGIPSFHTQNNMLQQVPMLQPQSFNGVDNVNVRNMGFSIGRNPGISKPRLPQAISGHPIYSLATSTGEVVSRFHDRSMDFSGSSFSPVGMSKPREEVNVPHGYVHNYDVFHHLNQKRAQEWCLQNAGPSFERLYVKGEQSRPIFSEDHCNMPNVGHLEQFGEEEDLMSTLLKEQQEGMGVGSIAIANELGSFDAYHLDNLPV